MTEEVYRTAHERGRRILVVDDDPEMVRQCATILAEEGYTVLQAPGSTEALQLCATSPSEIHLLLVDRVLNPPSFQLAGDHPSFPRVHGQELFRLMKAMNTTLRVLLMTDHVTADSGTFLQKPFLRETFVARIEHTLNAPLVAEEPVDQPTPQPQDGEIAWFG